MFLFPYTHIQKKMATYSVKVSALCFTSKAENKRVQIRFEHINIDYLIGILLRITRFYTTHKKPVPNILNELLDNLIPHGQCEKGKYLPPLKEDYWTDVQYLNGLVDDFQFLHNILNNDVDGLCYTDELEKVEESVYTRLYQSMLDELKTKKCLDYDHKSLECPQTAKALHTLLPELEAEVFIGKDFLITKKHLRLYLEIHCLGKECNSPKDSDILCFCDFCDNGIIYKKNMLIHYLYAWDILYEGMRDELCDDEESDEGEEE